MEKERKREAQKFENLEEKRKFFGKIKWFLMIFLKFYFDGKHKIVGTSFSSHNKISYIKNLMHIWFYQKYNTKICPINLGFSKFLSWPLSSSSWSFLSLSLCLSIYEIYSIKYSYFTENVIYFKLDLETPNTADSYHRKPGTIYSQWNYLS